MGGGSSKVAELEKEVEQEKNLRKAAEDALTLAKQKIEKEEKERKEIAQKLAKTMSEAELSKVWLNLSASTAN